MRHLRLRGLTFSFAMRILKVKSVTDSSFAVSLGDFVAADFAGSPYRRFERMGWGELASTV